MLVYTPRQRYLVASLSTCRSGKSDLCQIALDDQNSTTDLRSTDVDEKLFTHSQFLDLREECVSAIFGNQTSGLTLAAFLSACALTPNSRLSKKTTKDGISGLLIKQALLLYSQLISSST